MNNHLAIPVKNLEEPRVETDPTKIGDETKK